MHSVSGVFSLSVVCASMSVVYRINIMCDMVELISVPVVCATLYYENFMCDWGNMLGISRNLEIQQENEGLKKN